MFFESDKVYIQELGNKVFKIKIPKLQEFTLHVSDQDIINTRSNLDDTVYRLLFNLLQSKNFDYSDIVWSKNESN